MSTTTRKAPAPRKRRFTVDEYYRMAEAGVFGENDRVELLDGQIYVMSPIGSEHASCVDRLTRLFVRRAGDDAIVRIQNPIRLNEASEPEPDLALLHPRDDAYASEHPGPEDVMIIVEVAETSLEFDRDVKLPLYATADIPEVWLVDLEADTIHVYRDPSDDRYTAHETYGPDDELALSSLPALTPIPGSDILPPPQSDD
jgi:Uma2 family endonuclease